MVWAWLPAIGRTASSLAATSLAVNAFTGSNPLNEIQAMVRQNNLLAPENINQVRENWNATVSYNPRLTLDGKTDPNTKIGSYVEQHAVEGQRNAWGKVKNTPVIGAVLGGAAKLFGIDNDGYDKLPSISTERKDVYLGINNRATAARDSLRQQTKGYK